MAERTFSCLTYSKTAMRLRGGPIVQEIFKNIDDFRADKRMSLKNRNKIPAPTKMHLYSGHDTTLAVLLQALNVFSPHLPPYSSTVIIELHKKPQAVYYPSNLKSESDLPCRGGGIDAMPRIPEDSDDDYFIRVANKHMHTYMSYLCNQEISYLTL
jgi:hypothetical protein